MPYVSCGTVREVQHIHSPGNSNRTHNADRSIMRSCIFNEIQLLPGSFIIIQSYRKSSLNENPAVCVMCI